jgi:hypothetical protein
MKSWVFAAVMLLFINPASAAILEYRGIITSMTGQTGDSALYGLAEVGDIVTGVFSYDPTGVTDTNSWDAVGNYTFNEFNSSLTLTILDVSDGGTVLYEYNGHLDHITTNNNWEYLPNPSLFPVIDSFVPVGILDTGSMIYLRYQNRDTNLDLITSDALPDFPLLFEDYNTTTGAINLPSGVGQIGLDLTGLTVVPLPPSLLFLLSGTILLAIGKRRS